MCPKAPSPEAPRPPGRRGRGSELGREGSPRLTEHQKSLDTHRHKSKVNEMIVDKVTHVSLELTETRKLACQRAAGQI